MAIPPEPIEEVIGTANGAVMAEVARVVQQDKQEPIPRHPPGATDVPGDAARQVVELKVSAVIFGDIAKVGASIEAVKPAGAYALRAGNKGPFLLKKAAKGFEIVGRYGPDTYSEAKIRAAAAKKK